MFRTYYQLTKPGIIYGNLLTAAGGFLLASKGQVNWWLLLATLAGTSLIIASGCVFNNYLDRTIDKKMARTKQRALATGLVPVRSAIMYGTVLGLLGVLILSVWTSFLVLSIGLVAWLFYVAVYGIAKRRSLYGTLVGTIPGAAPMVAGYVAVTNQFDLGALLLFVIMVCWQMPHFYAIAMYRFKDYKAAGLPVLPVKRGMLAAKRQILAYIVAFIIACAGLSAFGYTGYVFVVVMAALGAYWLYLGIKNFQVIKDKAWGRKMFLFSLIVIMSLSIMLPIGAVLP